MAVVDAHLSADFDLEVEAQEDPIRLHLRQWHRRRRSRAPGLGFGLAGRRAGAEEEERRRAGGGIALRGCFGDRVERIQPCLMTTLEMLSY